MKRQHRPDLYAWSQFDEARNIDFNSLLWARPEGGVIVDPLPLTDHDRAHLEQLGGAMHVIITNSDHVRDAAELAKALGAKLYGPAAERDTFPVVCDEWLADGDEPVPGLRVLALDGSKTPGELALLIEDTTLVTGDLVRAHEGGRLCCLPAPKLTDATAAQASVARLAALPEVEAVVVGDGYPIFRDGRSALSALLG